jgi:hypothetical protein
MAVAAAARGTVTVKPKGRDASGQVTPALPEQPRPPRPP